MSRNFVHIMPPCFRSLALSLMVLGTSVNAADLRYRIVDLGPIEGGLSSYSYGLNDNGDVVGHSVVGVNNGNIAHSRPVIWRSGGPPERLWAGAEDAHCYIDPMSLEAICDPPVVLGELLGGEPRAINNVGTIVGQAQGSGYDGTPLPTGGIPDGVAFVWDEMNGRQTLGTLGGSNSEARGINDAGTVVGSADVLREFDFGQGPMMLNVPRAFIWDELNGMRELGTLGDDDDGSRGMGINNVGQVVGWSSMPDGRDVAFMWDEVNGMIELAGIARTDLGNRAVAINDLGFVVGFGGNAQGMNRAVLWNLDGKVLDLGVLPGDINSRAVDINDQGVVIGHSHPASGMNAFIWDEIHGMRSVQSRLMSAGEWTELTVSSINNRNEIVGYAFNGDVLHGFVLVPVPEPTAMTLFGMLVMCMASIQILRRQAAPRSQSGAVWTMSRLVMKFAPPRSAWLALAVVGLGSSANAADLRYRIVDLGPIENASQSFAYGLNDHGDAVGHAIVDVTNGNIANSRPVIWKSGGAPERLWYGDLEVCYLDAELGYVCEEGKPVVFGNLIGGEPRAINNAGVIVGQAQSSGYVGTPLPTGGIRDGVAFAWDELNGRRVLGTLGGNNSEARAVNDNGIVAGSADVIREFDFGQGPVLMSVPRAFVWDEVNGMRDLGTLGTDQNSSRGTGINNLGQVVGWSTLPDGRSIAFIWDEEGGMRVLPGLAPARRK